MDDEKLTDEQAEAMLKRLTRHYHQPVMPINRYCDALREWAACIKELNLPGRNYGKDLPEDHKHGQAYVNALDHILRDISKSNLLARLLYDGEKIRTIPCPEHNGHWSGIMECAYGCQQTGWIAHEKPSREAIEKCLNEYTARAKDPAASSFYTSLVPVYQKMLAHFYPEAPGTGIEAPITLEHTLAVCVFREGPCIRVDIRFDMDARLRTGEQQGHKVRDVPKTAIEDALVFSGVLARIVRDVEKLYEIPESKYGGLTVSKIEDILSYADECGRRGITLGHASLRLNNASDSQRDLEVTNLRGGILDLLKTTNIPDTKVVVPKIDRTPLRLEREAIHPKEKKARCHLLLQVALVANIHRTVGPIHVDLDETVPLRFSTYRKGCCGNPEHRRGDVSIEFHEPITFCASCVLRHVGCFTPTWGVCHLWAVTPRQIPSEVFSTSPRNLALLSNLIVGSRPIRRRRTRSSTL